MNEPVPTPRDAGSAAPGPASAGADDTGAASAVSSTALFGGRSQLAIRHGEAVYYLRQTRFGKLILTK